MGLFITLAVVDAMHPVKVCVSGAECGFRAFQSGDAAAAAVCSVSSVTVVWMRLATVSPTHQK